MAADERRWTPIRRIRIVAGLCVGALFGQTAEPKFQIADVHSSPHSSSPAFMRGGFYRGGRYEVRQASMVDLIGLAYGVNGDRILGGPSWLEMDRFDVVALAPAGATPDSAKVMLQNLLADRFKLVIHTDKKDLPTYGLVAGRSRCSGRPTVRVRRDAGTKCRVWAPLRRHLPFITPAAT